MAIDQLKKSMQGAWVSIAPEIRPSATKNADGTLKPFYLTRSFSYREDDSFELTVTNLADPFGKVPLAKMEIAGHMRWEGDHPIAAGAQKVNFIADSSYRLTPLLQPFADVMNQFGSKGFNTWEVNTAQDIIGKAFAPFGLGEGQFFTEFDLVYLLDEFLFWGARNIDGRSFDTEANRPTNLQIPMIRKK